MGKKLIKYLFLALMLCFSVNINVEASDEYNENYSYYTLSDYSVNGTYTLSFGLNHKKKIAAVTGFTEGEGFDGHVDIPSEVQFATDGVTMDTYTVVGVLKTAFYKNESLLSIKLPNTVTFLDTVAFEYCEYLEKVELGTGLEIVLEDCFASCSALSEINLESTKVVELSKRAFYSCNALASINFPESLLYIDDSCFSYCSALQTLKLPKSLKGLGEFFINGTAIKELSIPSSIEKMDIYTLKSMCLTSVTFEEGLKVLPDNAMAYIEGVEINLPSTLEEVGRYAFDNADLPDNFKLPSSVTTLNVGAFSNTTLNNNFKVPDSVKVFKYDDFTHEGVFTSTIINKGFSLPTGLTEIPRLIFYKATLPDDFKIPNTVTKINKNAFSFAKGSKLMEIPEGVVELEGGAFMSSTVLKDDLVLPTSLKVLGVGSLCNSSTKITITSELEFGHTSFGLKGVENNVTIVFDDGITRVPSYMFQGFNGNLEVILPNSITTIGKGAFDDSCLSSIVLPSSLKIIEADAFSSSKITSIILPEGLETIDAFAFEWCDLLQEIRIPSSVKELGDACFASCDALERVVLVDGLTAIWSEVFMDCPRLNSIELPSTLTWIGNSAFEGTALSELKLPNGVSYIGTDAFSTNTLKEFSLGCLCTNSSNLDSVLACDVNLDSLVVPYGASSIIFGIDFKVKEIYIPETVGSITMTWNKPEKIIGVVGTYAETFAKEEGIPFEECSSSVVDFEFYYKPETLNVHDISSCVLDIKPNAIKENVIWSSSNQSVVWVTNKGVLRAENAGVCDITATIGNVSKTFTVKVLKPIESFNYSENDKYIRALYVGQKIKLPITVNPIDAEEELVIDKYNTNYFTSDGVWLTVTALPDEIVYDSVDISIKGTNTLAIEDAYMLVLGEKPIEKATVNVQSDKLSWYDDYSLYDDYDYAEIYRYNTELNDWELYDEVESSLGSYNLLESSKTLYKGDNRFKVRFYVHSVDGKIYTDFSDEVVYKNDVEVELGTTEKPSVEETTEPIQDDTLKESEEMPSEEVTTEKQSESEKDSTTTKPSEEESTTEKPSEEETTSKEEETTEKPSEEETTSKEEETTEKPSEEETTSKKEETTSKVEETTSKEEETTEKPSEKPTEKPSEDNKDEVEKFKAQKIAVKVEKISNEYYLTWNKIDADGYNILVGNDTSYFSELVTVRDTKYKLPAKFVSDAFVLGIQGYKIIDGKVVYTNRSNIVAFEFKLTAAKNLKQKSTYTNKIEISWGKVPNATGYEVWRATTKNSKYKKVATTTVNSLKQYVTGGSAYWYKVRACRVTSVGTVKYGDFSAPTKLYSKPSTPVITAKKAAGTKIKVSWEKSVGANCYDIYMSNSKSGTYRLVKTRKSTHNKYYTFTNLTRGKTYYFKIRTYKIDGSGNKIYSNWSTIKSVKLNK